ncbi:hypothetical protein MLD38_005674 [Melastoma candidum]|uniref:Uncharacterized protein n=1 Tax=Melastoma candidum TaxID=119954 RepID=A0ACB9RK56_9MYRT|nr:hypothetical protein MLD38_005674 [Melastoma candidum]
MAGMLPGVECARRRRIHQGGSGTSYDPQSTAACGWTRRPYFSLFTSSHEMHHGSAGAMRHAGGGGEGGGGGYSDNLNLGGAAREAKERLDMKLRSQLKSESGRWGYVGNGQSSMRAAVAPRNLQTEVLGTRKEGGGGSLRMLKWGRMKWRSMEQEECAVCLERFRIGENLMNLQCGHRFHTRCLVPWLDSNSHCPCCRMDVSLPSPSPSPV